MGKKESTGLIDYIVGLVLGILMGGVEAFFSLGLSYVVFLLVVIIGLFMNKKFTLGYVVGYIVSRVICLLLVLG
jgi:hypothetical protein